MHASMTRRYGFAVAVIALTIVTGCTVSALYLEHQRRHTEVINIASTQRMLPQHLSVLAVRAAATGFDADLRLRMQAALDRMHRGHRFLTEADGTGGLPPALETPELASHYFGSSPSLDVRVRRFIGTIASLIVTRNHDPASIAEITDISTGPLIGDLDYAVTLFERHAQEQSTSSFVLHIVIAAMALLVLLLEVIFIFRPMAREVSAQALAVEAERTRFHEVLEALPAAVYTTDLEGRITFYNAAAQKLAGGVGDLAEKRWCVTHKLYTADGEALAHEDCPMAQTVKSGREIRGVEAIAERLDGTRIPFTPFPSLLRGPDGEVTGAVNLLVDISERKASEEAMRKQNAWLDAAINNISVGLCFYGEDNRLLVANKRFRQIFELPEELARQGIAQVELLNHCVSRGLYDRALTPERFIELRLARTRSRKPITSRHTFHSGRVLVVSQRHIPGEGWVVTYDDVTERHKAEEQIEFLARHDAMTELANRPELTRHLADALATRREGRAVAVYCLDLDRFKETNDTLGHAVGDGLLREVGRRLKETARGGDLVARTGGDEFAVIQDIDREETAPRNAERILSALLAPYTIEGHTILIGASVGIALAPRHGEVGADLLRYADLALYEAKKSNRGSYRIFDTALSDALEQRKSLEHDLGIALRDGALALHYQPLVGVESTAIEGFEALLRWQHPTLGFIPPSDFIPIAEDSGLMNEISAWVLMTACREAASWPGDIGVSVNIGAAEFASGTLTTHIVAAIEGSGLPPQRLTLEITETTLLSLGNETVTALNWLRDIGVKIAIDDFGTGYSSLDYLDRLPLDSLKIDRSFLRNITANRTQAILETIVGLARALEITTVVEGVETEEQREIAKASGCTRYQGFLFSRPVPAAAARELLRAMAPPEVAAA